MSIRNLLLLSLCGLLATAAEAVRTQELGWDNSGNPFPRFAFGSVAGYELGTGGIRFRRTLDGHVSSFSTMPPGYALLRTRDVATSARGQVVAAVGLQKANGERDSALLWHESAVGPGKVVSTGNFAAIRIAFATDGSLWAIGRQHDGQGRDVPGFQMLRRYGPDGRLIGESYSSKAYLPLENPAAYARLFACGPRMMAILPTVRELVEFDGGGEVAGRWPMPEFEDVVGSACANGSVFITASSRAPGTGGKESVVRQYRLERKGERTVAVDVSTSLLGQAQGILVGGEEEALVFYTKTPRSALQWVSPPR